MKISAVALLLSRLTDILDVSNTIINSPEYLLTTFLSHLVLWEKRLLCKCTYVRTFECVIEQESINNTLALLTQIIRRKRRRRGKTLLLK